MHHPGSIVHWTAGAEVIQPLDKNVIANARLIAAAHRMLGVLEGFRPLAVQFGVARLAELDAVFTPIGAATP